MSDEFDGPLKDAMAEHAKLREAWNHYHALTQSLLDRAEKAEKERDEAEADYNTLVGLLKKRFPPLPNGNLPDFEVEDVLLENARLREENERLKRMRKVPQTLKGSGGNDL